MIDQSVRVHFYWSGAYWTCDLPSYNLVPDSWLPIDPAYCTESGPVPGADPADPWFDQLTALVQVPDSQLAQAAQLGDQATWTAAYPGVQVPQLAE